MSDVNRFLSWLIASAWIFFSVSYSAVAEDKKITLAVPGIPPVFQTVHVFVAEKQGFFKKYGVDVTVRPFDTGVAAARAVAAGEIDITVSPTPAIVNMTSNADVKLVGIYGQENPDWLIGSTDPGLASCKDIAGKPVGVDTVGGARAVALAQMIKSCGLKTDDVNLVSLSSNVGSAMIAGQIKIGVLHLDDVPQIEAQTNRPLTVITTLKKVNPISHYNLYAVTADRLKQDRNAFVRLLAALIEAGDYLRDPKNADRVAEIATVTGRSAAEAKTALKAYIDMDFWPNRTDGLTRQNIESVVKTQAAIGGIRPGKTPVTYDHLIDPSLWKDALALTKAR
ncbi:MAG TPA: ABC transporter substrate-binding protein [Acidiferrobacterales bacterium]|nr:ABC transporter substrate-binding protein [Acidiferrobacterales bacterium]